MSHAKVLAQGVLARMPVRALPAPRGRLRRDLRRRYERAVQVHPREFTTTVGSVSLSGSTVDFIQRHVLAYDVWEPNITAVFKDSLRPGDAVLDVGANWGYFTALSSELVGSTGSVVAIEAVPSIYARLAQALKRSDVRNVHLINAAAGPSRGSIEMFRGTPDNLGNSTSVAQAGYVSEGLVELVPLDEILDEDFISRLSLIKIDTEGDEVRVLEGMPNTLSRLKKGARVLVEVTPDMLAERDGDARDVSAHFPPDRWDAYRIDNDYEPAAYMADPVPPVRHEGPVTDRADMMFIRRR